MVVGSGGGMIGRFLLGKRVACGGNEPGGGTWAEYFVASVMLCFPLRKDVDFVAGATMLVNPLTALAFVDTAKQRRASAIVHTAAASQLGRLVAIFARERDLPVIHVVRREAQVELLRELGAEHVLNSSDEDHDEKEESEEKEEKAEEAGTRVGEHANIGMLTIVLASRLQPRATPHGGALLSVLCWPDDYQ